MYVRQRCWDVQSSSTLLRIAYEVSGTYSTSFYFPDQAVSESGIISKLYEMIRDKDAIVVCNCLTALNEILMDEGGLLKRFSSSPAASVLDVSLSVFTISSSFSLRCCC